MRRNKGHECKMRFVKSENEKDYYELYIDKTYKGLLTLDEAMKIINDSEEVESGDE